MSSKAKEISAQEPRPRGRPRDPLRLEKVLDAARAQFSGLGYEGASIDAIAAASGVSKVTIYSYFPTKAALFEASINHRLESEFAMVDWPNLDPAAPREELARIGSAFLSLLRSPDVINKQRLLYGAQGQDTTAAEGYYSAGPEELRSALAGYLQRAGECGSLNIANFRLAAEQFLSLFQGLGHIRGLLGLPLPGKRQDTELLTANVELFMRAFAHERAGTSRARVAKAKAAKVASR
jgi:TetR/AcrR family transcriptional repressor of mexJK operon